MTTCRSSRQRDARCWSEARRCCCRIWQLDLRAALRACSMRFFDWPAPDSVGYQDSISIVIVEHNLDLVLALAGKGDQESWFKTCRCGDCGYIGRMPVSSPDLKAFLLATPFFGGLSDASLDLL